MLISIQKWYGEIETADITTPNILLFIENIYRQNNTTVFLFTVIVFIHFIKMIWQAKSWYVNSISALANLQRS